MPLPDAAAGAASNAFSKRVHTFRIHPNVVRNWLEHHSHVKDQLAAHCGDISLSEDVPKMSGCVIGMENGRTVEILDSLDLLFDPDPVSGTLCRALLEKKEHYKQLLPGSVVLGWYSSETRSAVQDTDMQIHKALMDTEGRAFCLLLNVAINLSDIDLRVSIYDSVLRDTNGGPQLNLIEFECSIEYLELEKISVDRSTGFKQCLLCPNRAVSDVNLLPLEKEDGACYVRQAFRMMLLETPSGFAIFSVSERFLMYPEETWAWFTSLNDAHDAVSLLGFIQVEDKSVAWKSDVGPGEDLEKFILKFVTTHPQELIVPDTQLKFVIEKKLKVICWFDGRIVRELKWGLEYVLHEFVPTENECYLYLSNELEKKIKAYGFSVSPRMIDRKFINTVGELYKLDLTSESISMFLHRKFDSFFPQSRMPDKEFANAIADWLHSEEMISNYGEYSKQDILRFTKFLLEAPVLKNDAISRLKCMETAAGSAEARDKEPKLLVTLEAATSKQKAVGKDKEEDDSDYSKPETRKRGAAGSPLGMPASNKKAKVAKPPGQKTGYSKGPVHVATPCQTPATNRKSPRFSRLQVLQEDKQKVIIERVLLGDCRCVTMVKGLELFGVKLSVASRRLCKKFDTQAVVFKEAGKDQILVFGDISCHVVDFITHTWPDVLESAIHLIDGSKAILS